MKMDGSKGGVAMTDQEQRERWRGWFVEWWTGLMGVGNSSWHPDAKVAYLAACARATAEQQQKLADREYYAERADEIMDKQAAEIEHKDELYESATGLIDAFKLENASKAKKIEQLTSVCEQNADALTFYDARGREIERLGNERGNFESALIDAQRKIKRMKDGINYRYMRKLETKLERAVGALDHELLRTHDYSPDTCSDCECIRAALADDEKHPSGPHSDEDTVSTEPGG